MKIIEITGFVVFIYYGEKRTVHSNPKGPIPSCCSTNPSYNQIVTVLLLFI